MTTPSRLIGSRVWDGEGVEPEEHDPRFREAVFGRWTGPVERHGIAGGGAIFRRAVPASPPARIAPLWTTTLWWLARELSLSCGRAADAPTLCKPIRSAAADVFWAKEATNVAAR